MSIAKTLHTLGLLRDIDYYFAKNICESFGAPEGELLFALVFASTQSGSTSLDTGSLSSFEFYDKFAGDMQKACSAENIDTLTAKGAIAKAPETGAPFILSGQKLYMKSFYTDEKDVAKFLSAPATDICADDRLTELLGKYFSENSMQKAAALNTALNRFSVISGGPGTGKTSTVFKLLAVLLEMSATPLRIAVCAPTGKAASRLTETISENREKYKNESYIDQIPEKAVTVHRLLGMYGDTRRPVYNTDNKLSYDIIVADEASMLDVRLMAKLTAALSDSCRLVLLGDKDQLASVQPGAVLGDICSAAPVAEFTAKRADLLRRHTDRELAVTDSPYADITILLDKSYRYDSTKGIGLLADACGRGDWHTAMQVLKNDTTGRVDYIEMSDSFEETIGRFTLNHFESYAACDTPQAAIEAFNKFRILTPHRVQAGGTENINATAAKALFRAGYSDNTKRFFHGMPVMIVENDYSLNLYNGETGVIFENDGLKADFIIDGRVRSITPSRLPGYVPAFSMTVHKSQGSEFEHVLFVLPESDSRILTRELFYTAVTRAKSRLTVISTEKAVQQCITSRIERTSGLFG